MWTPGVLAIGQLSANVFGEASHPVLISWLLIQAYRGVAETLRGCAMPSGAVFATLFFALPFFIGKSQIFKFSTDGAQLC